MENLKDSPIYPSGVSAYTPPAYKAPVDEQQNNSNTQVSQTPIKDYSHIDFTEIKYPARIAVYDDLLSSPRVLVVEPCEVSEYLNKISTASYDFAHQQGSTIPYTVIRELVENFIHAYFIEPTVSILDNGSTIRFTDQGPGISDIEQAKKPGVTSANFKMKRYIRGVGSGLPTVNEYLSTQGGSLQIENNIHSGCVVTISIKSAKDHSQTETIQEANQAQAHVQTRAHAQTQIQTQAQEAIQPSINATLATQLQEQIQNQEPQERKELNSTQVDEIFNAMSFEEYQAFIAGQYGESHTKQGKQEITLTSRQVKVLKTALHLGKVGPTELKEILNISDATAHRDLKYLEQLGYINADDTGNKKRSLTEQGFNYLKSL